MNAYITLDGDKYTTTFGAWSTPRQRPMQVKTLLNGNADVTFGPAIVRMWSGEVRAYVTPPGEDYGSYSDLMTLIESLATVEFYDHDGNGFNVVIAGDVNPQSTTPMWDDASNMWRFSLTLIQLSEIEEP